VIADDPDAPLDVTVMTLNAATLFEAGWSERRSALARWIALVDPDIVCLQEVFGDEQGASAVDQIFAPDGECPRHGVFGGFPVDESLWPERDVMLGSFIASRWPIEHRALIALPTDDTPGAPAHFRMQLEVLHARTRGVDVYSTHLAPSPRQGYHRVRQVVHLDRFVRESVQAACPNPPIICGDFNAEPESDEIRFLCGFAVIDGATTYYQDAWRVARGGEPGHTWDIENPNASALNVPSKRIDYVFVGDPFQRPDSAGRICSSSLVCNSALNGFQFPSDHYGLVATISLSNHIGG